MPKRGSGSAPAERLPMPLNTYVAQDLDRIPQLQKLSAEVRDQIRIVAKVLPFKTNNYVVDELIEWDAGPDDPIYRLTFGHPEMLRPDDFSAIAALAGGLAPTEMLQRKVR